MNKTTWTTDELIWAGALWNMASVSDFVDEEMPDGVLVEDVLIAFFNVRLKLQKMPSSEWPAMTTPEKRDAARRYLWDLVHEQLKEDRQGMPPRMRVYAIGEGEELIKHFPGFRKRQRERLQGATKPETGQAG